MGAETQSSAGRIDSGDPVPEVRIDDSELSTLRARPSLNDYLRRLWSARFFIFADARAKSFADGRGQFLGALWVVLNPLIQVATYAVIFGLVLKVSRGMDNFIGFLVLGVTFFGFISSGITAGGGLMQRSRSFLISFNLPKACVVASMNLRSIFDHIFPALMAVLVALLFQLGKPPSWTIILVVPLFLLIHIFTLGIQLAVARMTAFVPDVKSLLSVFTRMLFFLSGVFWPIERFSGHPALMTVLKANPVYQFLTAIRKCVLDGVAPMMWQWGYLTAWSVGLLVIGMVYFWGAEARYASVK